MNRFKSLTESRNDIVHSTWYVGWGNESTTDFSDASGVKLHKDKSGAIVKSFERKAADFAVLTAEAETLTKIYGRLQGCLLGGFKMEKNFLLSPEGRVLLPPGA